MTHRAGESVRWIVGVATMAALAALATLGGCAQEASRPEDEPPAAARIGETTMRACPKDDRVWTRAIEQAEAEGRLPAMMALALEVARAHPDRWEPEWALGETRLRATDPAVKAASTEAFTRALEIAERVEDLTGIARAANRLGGVARRAREFASAETHYRRALGAARTLERDDLMGAILSNLGGLLHNTGRLAEALIVLEEASTRLARAGNRQQAMQFAYNQAVILGELGQLTAKRRLLESTHTEAVAGGAHDLVAAISVALGNLHLLQDDLDGAQRWFAAVPPDHPAQGAWAALGLGRVAVERESYAEAAQQFDRVQRSETGAIVQVMAATRRAELELRRGAAASALTMLEPLLSSAEQGLNVAWMVPTLYGKALLATGRPESEAVPHFRAAVAAVESRGAGLDPTGAGMTYLRERSEPFAELSWTLAVDPASAASVLQVVEQAHARSLRQLLREEGRAPPPFTGLTALQRRLAPGDLLLDYLIGEERGVLVAVTADVARVVRLPGWSTLREPLQRYRAALRRPLTSAEARLDPSRDLLRDLAQGHTLRQALLGPVEALVRAADRLLVVPDQDLALLPLAALPSVEPLRFLGDEVAIALLPMAGAPVALRDAAGPLLLAGDPLSDAQGEFPVLPLAGRELDEVEAIWLGHEVTRLRRGDLRAERLRRLDLAAFRALHFATHAEASSSDPQRCAVILSEGERLGMHEIAALQLSPSLVILSACRTGEGEVIPGEGVVGLSWAFLRAGAGGVVASLWNVEDAATTALMVELHRELRRGSEPARALREAQRSARVGQRHPAYWAGFVVMLGPAA